jgi:hypothetical protein
MPSCDAARILYPDAAQRTAGVLLPSYLAQLLHCGPVMASDDLCLLDLVEIGRRIQARQLSSVEVTQAVLDRIARLDGRLKSYVTLTADLALAEAGRYAGVDPLSLDHERHHRVEANLGTGQSGRRVRSRPIPGPCRANDPQRSGCGRHAGCHGWP